MNRKATNLLATLKAVNDFGGTYAADFPPTSIGGKQFALISDFVKAAGEFGLDQVSGTNQGHSGVLSELVARAHLHDDMLAINHAAHSLALLGTEGIEGKFAMPHKTGAQACINAGRAFAQDAIPYSAQFIELGLPADFLAHLAADIEAYEAAIVVKGQGSRTEVHGTAGILDNGHKAITALHILDTVVRNTYKTNAARLAEWFTARHIERTPQTQKPPVTPAPTPTP